MYSSVSMYQLTPPVSCMNNVRKAKGDCVTQMNFKSLS